MNDLSQFFDDEYKQRAAEAMQKYASPAPRSEVGKRVAKLLPVKLADWPEACAQLSEEYPGATFAIVWPYGSVGLVLEVDGG